MPIDGWMMPQACFTNHLTIHRLLYKTILWKDLPTYSYLPFPFETGVTQEEALGSERGDENGSMKMLIALCSYTCSYSMMGKQQGPSKVCSHHIECVAKLA